MRKWEGERWILQELEGGMGEKGGRIYTMK